MDAEEVVQLYLTDLQASTSVPLFSLKGFKRIALKAGESTTVQFTINPDMLKMINDKGESVLEKGKFAVYLSGSAPVSRSTQLGSSPWVKAEFSVK
jgi:beta-glucosidase